MVFMEQQRGALEEVVSLLESVRGDLATIEKPTFEEKQMDGYLVTALSAARSALGISSRLGDPAQARKPGL